jgi:hypothetical protein
MANTLHFIRISDYIWLKIDILKKSELKYKIASQEHLSKKELFSKSCRRDWDKEADVLEVAKVDDTGP